MPNINLIAQKRQDKLRMQRHVRWLFLLTSGLFVISILLFIVMSAQWFRTHGQINDLKDELTKLKPTIDEIKRYEAQTAELAPKIELYSKAREHTLRWYAYLQIVARCLPESTWLTKITPGQSTARPDSKGPPPGAVVNLTGMTVSQKLVGDTMLSLNRFPRLMDKVELHYTQRAQVGDVPAVEFEIATNIKDLPAVFQDQPPQPPAETAESGKQASAKGAGDGAQTKS